MRVRRLRRTDDGDRLRRERAARCRAREVLRAGDQAREAGLQAMRGVRRGGSGAARADHRKVAGLGPDRDRYDGSEVLRLDAALSPECDAEARHGPRYQPLHHGWVGDAGWRVADAHGWSHAPRVTPRGLYPG